MRKTAIADLVKRRIFQHIIRNASKKPRFRRTGWIEQAWFGGVQDSPPRLQSSNGRAAIRALRNAAIFGLQIASAGMDFPETPEQTSKVEPRPETDRDTRPYHSPALSARFH